MTTAWVFAGHGSQYPGMGRAILRDTDVGRRWLADAEAISGLALGQFAEHGPRSNLADPRVLEPLLAAIGGAHSDLRRAEEGPPAAVAGYSAGHVPALYAAGVIDRCTCLEIACLRGAELTRAAANVPGGMVAVHGLPEEQLVWLAEDDADDPASIAARNAPMHVVYTGTQTALASAAARASAAGAITAPLDVAGPWHSAWLEPAMTAIATGIAALPFRDATMPVWSTVTGLPTQDRDRLRWALGASVAHPVEWQATVVSMLDAGIDAFVEVSPGRALWGLLGQIAPSHGFTRRYVECVRGLARRRGVVVRPSVTSPQAVTAQGPA